MAVIPPLQRRNPNILCTLVILLIIVLFLTVIGFVKFMNMSGKEIDQLGNERTENTKNIRDKKKIEV